MERTLLKVLGDVQAQPTALPPLTEPVRDDMPYTPFDAVNRCREAWQKAYDAYMEKNAHKRGGASEYSAALGAGAAYRAAMPQLATWMGIRDFIACVAYGVLIEAIPEQRTGQLLYAAQVALSLLPRIPNWAASWQVSEFASWRVGADALPPVLSPIPPVRPFLRDLKAPALSRGL
jgi:hypothetical protein